MLNIAVDAYLDLRLGKIAWSSKASQEQHYRPGDNTESVPIVSRALPAEVTCPQGMPPQKGRHSELPVPR